MPVQLQRLPVAITYLLLLILKLKTILNYSRKIGRHKNLNESNMVIGDSPVFMEEGAEAYAAVFNTLEGPIYIGKNALVMEGALIRGPFALGESSTVKMGATIYGATSIGPHCKVGGEVSNSVLFGYSNKGHDGYLGNSVLGEWCNLGADTNTSNLKNNYDEVKLWNYNQEKFEKTGLQFCGLIMGDHSKTSIKHNAQYGHCDWCVKQYIWKWISTQLCAIICLGGGLQVFQPIKLQKHWLPQNWCIKDVKKNSDWMKSMFLSIYLPKKVNSESGKINNSIYE